METKSKHYWLTILRDKKRVSGSSDSSTNSLLQKGTAPKSFAHTGKNRISETEAFRRIIKEMTPSI